jgi:hypothetical protein
VNADEFFLDSLEDLERRIGGHLMEYDMLHVAALLRRLLTDRTPLADRVNRSRHLRIRYQVRERHVPKRNARLTWAALEGFDPETGRPEGNVLELSRDQMLARIILHHDGADFTVAEVIKYLANVAGGVHSGDRVDEKERTLAAVREHFRFHDLSVVLGSLLAVGRVVIKGLKPLRDTVEAHLRATAPEVSRE